MRNGSLIARWVLAGPVVLIGAVALMAATPFFLPPGVGGVNHLIFALLLFPVYWSGLFFYAILEEKMWRCALVIALILAPTFALIIRSFIT